MANFKYYENDYEMAVLELLDNSKWDYECGYDIHRENTDIILRKDFERYLSKRYGVFSDDEVQTLIAHITSYSSQSLYRCLKETYGILGMRRRATCNKIKVWS